MKVVWWMVAGPVTSSVAMTAFLGAEAASGIWLGMLAPVASMVVAWVLVERMYRRRPEGVTPLMIKAFAAKMLFFAVYIILIVSTEFVRPVPFVVSFTFHYLALHVMMAVSLHRLMATGRKTSPGTLQT
jgi:hypothetical protein